MWNLSDWANEVEALEARLKVLEKAAQEFVEAVALGPLDAAAKYGPDFDLDEHLKDRTVKLLSVLTIPSGQRTGREQDENNST